MENPLEIPGAARLLTGPGGLPCYEIATPLARAQIFLHGAHVARFAPAGEPPILFLSEKSYFDTASPIRGGVPVIFPWFGPRKGHPEAPSHGFARRRSWTPESLVQRADGAVVLTLRLEPDAASRAFWPEAGDWVLRHRITVAAALALELEIENRGSAVLRCEDVMHTYFHVSDVRQVCVRGLENAEYYDEIDGMRCKRQGAEPIRFTAETDRVYVDTDAACAVEDPGLGRRIVVEKTGARSTVVWNPWVGKSRAMADFGDAEWPGMVCVETGNVFENALEIAPGASHLSRTILRAEAL